MTVPQLHGQYEGDRTRKETLIEHGFRLPSAADNRPLRFEEFVERVNQVRVPVGDARRPTSSQVSAQVVEQIVRPDRPGRPRGDRQADQGPDRRPAGARSTTGSQRGERVLVTTLTKKMAEDLTDYLLELGVRVRYLHSEVDTIQRIEILRDLRLGEFDVLVGINLLREGLDLPEVSLVAILDADKEGFLRSETSLIQMIGRAARNVDGQVVMYADTGHRLDAAGHLARPTAGAGSSWPTTPSTASTPRPSARRSPTSSPTCGPRASGERAPVPGGDRRRPAGPRDDQAAGDELAELPRDELGPAHPDPRGGDARGRRRPRFEYAARLARGEDRRELTWRRARE